jgi:FkbM family methyltransferase
MNLINLLKPERLTEVVDIGANPCDGDPPYKSLLANGLCNVTGFEPQPDALQALVAQAIPHARYLPYAVGDGQAHTLNICHYSGWTSLLTPDPEAIRCFEYFTENSRIIDRVPVQTHRLDAIEEIEHLDYLKIDIQGGELDVFNSGTQKLRDAVFIQTEVSFVSLYTGQPDWARLHSVLSGMGFIPHTVIGLKKCIISPCIVNNDPGVPLNQVVEADVVYVKDFIRPDWLSDEQLKHMAIVAHHCYQSFDLTMRCIRLLEARGAVAEGAMNDYVRGV